MASFADARAQGGEWLVRMEDLDPPREVRGAADAILRALEHYGFEWDGTIVYQSSRASHYEAALQQMRERELVFACACTRKDLSASPVGAGGERVYPGNCRQRALPFAADAAWRARVPQAPIDFTDLLQGAQQQSLAHEVGDFVIRRADGLFAYQLAVVVDDSAQGITHVVRGCDLLSSTARQIWLQRALDLATPQYLHIPIAINARGEKLSKQTLARALPNDGAMDMLRAAWRFLDQTRPPRDLATPREFWLWASEAWSRLRLPPVLMLPAPDMA